jgi:hypothetical protein
MQLHTNFSDNHTLKKKLWHFPTVSIFEWQKKVCTFPLIIVTHKIKTLISWNLKIGRDNFIPHSSQLIHIILLCHVSSSMKETHLES